jgi:hypothetical protein
MAKVIGNGMTAKFGPVDSEVFIIAVTSISMDSAERPVIDITTASDTQRSGVPGLRGVPTGSVTGILEQGAANSDQIESIEDELTLCAVIKCVIDTKLPDCSTVATLLNADVHVTGFTIDASIDEAVSITVNFMLASGQKFVPDTEP